MIIGIDPSSTRTGWAVADQDGNVLSFGAITPDRDCDEDLRGVSIGRDLCEIVILHDDIDVAIIERPGRAMAGRLKRRSRDLGTYAWAAGQICAMIADDVGDVICVTPEAWTGGSSKQMRRSYCLASIPRYDKAPDSGGDISDAICLALRGVEILRRRGDYQ